MTQMSQATASVKHERRKRSRRAWWPIPLAVVTLVLLVYMLSAYVPPDMRTSRVDVHGDRVRYWLLVAHIGFGTIATVTGLRSSGRGCGAGTDGYTDGPAGLTFLPESSPP